MWKRPAASEFDHGSRLQLIPKIQPSPSPLRPSEQPQYPAHHKSPTNESQSFQKMGGDGGWQPDLFFVISNHPLWSANMSCRIGSWWLHPRVMPAGRSSPCFILVSVASCSKPQKSYKKLIHLVCHPCSIPFSICFSRWPSPQNSFPHPNIPQPHCRSGLKLRHSLASASRVAA